MNRTELELMGREELIRYILAVRQVAKDALKEARVRRRSAMEVRRDVDRKVCEFIRARGPEIRRREAEADYIEQMGGVEHLPPMTRELVRQSIRIAFIRILGQLHYLRVSDDLYVKRELSAEQDKRATTAT